MEPVEQINFETSSARAKRARTFWKTTRGGRVKEFQWRTGRWVWLPRITDHVYYGWNPAGGPASVVFHRQSYWLCLGWSTMEELPGTDPRVLAFRKESNHGGA